MDWMNGLPTRLGQQLQFLVEIDRLKSVVRATRNLHGGRLENTAEHSWYVALMGLMLAEHANEPVDGGRVAQMLLIHDLVEIDAGDHPLHAGHPPADQAAKEQAAAERIFGLLPDPQGAALKALWHEFEGMQSADARFAKAIDRFQPLMANMANDGGSWPQYDVSRAQLETRVGGIGQGSDMLWQVAQRIFDAGQAQGWIKA